MRRKTKGHSVLRQTWQVRCLPKYRGEQEIGRVQTMDWGFFSASHAKGRSCSLWSSQGDGRVPPTSEDFPERARTAVYDRNRKPREKKNAEKWPNVSCLPMERCRRSEGRHCVKLRAEGTKATSSSGLWHLLQRHLLRWTKLLVARW